ncbi:MAG: hypothetical protein AAF564_02315 [Bacteroidota bacterium]
MATNNGKPTDESELSTVIQEDPGETTNTHMGELEKVRSILFGEQIKVYEERMHALEGRVAKTLDTLRTDVGGQLEAMEERFKAQFDEMLELLGKETNNRENQRDALKKELGKVSETMDAFKAVQESRLDSVDTAFKNAMKEERAEIEQNLQENMQDLSEELRQALLKLEQSALYRGKFADMLTSLANEIAPNGAAE